MLLETYGNGDAGYIVYSKNKFDFLTNFTLVPKSDPSSSKFLDFKEIGEFINKPVKKNLILYRLLTNDEELDPFTSKLGFFLKLEGKIEIVYFDPIFMMKDLEHLEIKIPRDEFRIKVQQVGYKTKSIDIENVIFEEHFAIDMSNEEAENQNDSIFAETILSIGDGIIDDKKSDYSIFNGVTHEKKKSDRSGFYSLEKESEQGFNKRKTERENDFLSKVMHNKKSNKKLDNSSLNMFR